MRYLTHHIHLIHPSSDSWLRKIRTFIFPPLAGYSHPLNYKPSLYDLQNWTENSKLIFSFQKERKFNVLPLHQIAFSYWLTPGLEPCSPHSQCGTLPNKLKPTFVIGAGLEPTSSESNSEMLTHCTIQQSCAAWVNRTLSSDLEDRHTTINAYAAF